MMEECQLVRLFSDSYRNCETKTNRVTDGDEAAKLQLAS
jgi:hypothetical protein